MPLREERLLEIVISGSLFDYVHCDIEAPEKLRETFANFQTIFKNINVGGDDIGPVMKKIKTESLLTQPRRMRTSSFFL